jgi:hypothetical protein
MAEPDDDRIELTDLDVITRYSLAVRAATADRDELIDTLRADLDWLEAGRTQRTARRAAPRRATAKKASAGRTGSRRSG